MPCKIKQCPVLLNMAKYKCPKGTSFFLVTILLHYFFQNALNILAPKYLGLLSKEN